MTKVQISDRVTVLTGVTGFLGQELLGELLAAQPGDRIIALIRPSRGVGAEQRLQKLLATRFPDPIARESVSRRVVALEADLDRDDPVAELSAEFEQGLDGVTEKQVRARLVKIERVLAEWSKGRKFYGHMFDDVLKLKYLHQRYTNYRAWLRCRS